MGPDMKIDGHGRTLVRRRAAGNRGARRDLQQMVFPMWRGAA